MCFELVLFSYKQLCFGKEVKRFISLKISAWRKKAEPIFESRNNACFPYLLLLLTVAEF